MQTECQRAKRVTLTANDAHAQLAQVLVPTTSITGMPSIQPRVFNVAARS
jgi:hypothetical protein